MKVIHKKTIFQDLLITIKRIDNIDLNLMAVFKEFNIHVHLYFYQKERLRKKKENTEKGIDVI